MELCVPGSLQATADDDPVSAQLAQLPGVPAVADGPTQQLRQLLPQPTQLSHKQLPVVLKPSVRGGETFHTGSELCAVVIAESEWLNLGQYLTSRQPTTLRVWKGKLSIVLSMK